MKRHKNGARRLAEGTEPGTARSPLAGPMALIHMDDDAIEIATAQRDRALGLLSVLERALDGYQPHHVQRAIFEARALLVENGWRVAEERPPWVDRKL